MADYTSGAINFTGLGNGTDFSKLIEGLVKVEQQHTTTLQTWRSSWENKITAFQDLNTKLLSLKTTLEGLDTMNEFMVKNATSTDTSMVTATATSDAIESSHTLQINQLAQNDILINTAQGETAKTNTLVTSNTTFNFSYAGTAISLSIPSGTTLEGLVNIVNNSADTAGKVRATTIYDGTVYRLQIYGLDLGSTYQVVLSNSGIPNYQPASFGNTQNAQNAQFKVDGFPSAAGSWISRTSNTVSDVIEGLTLTLKQSTGGSTVKVSVDTDLEAVKENVRTFVSQVNDVRQTILDLTKVDTTTNQGSILTGNYGVELLIGQQLKDIIASKGLGFVYYNATTLTGDKISSLGQLGIATDADEGSSTRGLLKLDETVLDTVLASNADGAAKIFSAYYLGESDSSSFSYRSYINGITQAGSYAVSYTLSAAGISSAYINGHQALISGWEITGASGYDEAGIAIRVDNHTVGSYSGTVSLKVGKATELIDALKQMTSSTDGPLHILEDNYQDIIDNIDKKIDYEKARIDRLERDLKTKYANLDALLGQYDQLQTQLANQVAQLSKSS